MCSIENGQNRVRHDKDDWLSIRFFSKWKRMTREIYWKSVSIHIEMCSHVCRIYRKSQLNYSIGRKWVPLSEIDLIWNVPDIKPASNKHQLGQFDCSCFYTFYDTQLYTVSCINYIYVGLDAHSTKLLLYSITLFTVSVSLSFDENSWRRRMF